jgi:ABC-type nitrate/sulfonate/bicarbonate transport system ATPase subunit
MDSTLLVQAASKTYPQGRGGAVTALAETSISVRENEFLAIVGPSGCGKSTLLRLMAGLEKPSGGAISFQGQGVTRPSGRIGLVFQDYSLLPWRTLLRNIELGLEFQGLSRRQIRDKALEYLELVGLAQAQDAYPHELSGGMRQRAAIARALAVEPDVLLMDEPFGALDAHTRLLMQRELLGIWEKRRKTVVFVTHSIDEAVYLSDRIVVMDKDPGRVIEVLDVDLPRPRTRKNPDFGRLTESILEMLKY